MFSTLINMNQPLSIVFFGTEYLAEAVLWALLNDARFVVKAVVTQPDRPVGRKQTLQATPVKELALKHNLTVLQPEKLRLTSPDTLGFKPDFFVVAEFGQIIPTTWLDWPRLNTINVHPSILPQYRGPTPIHSAIWHGDTQTGVTIMELEPTVDTGPIVSVVTTTIEPTETYDEVEKKLATLGGPLLCDSLIKLAEKTITPVPQVEALATHCQKLTRDSGRVNWQQSAQTIYNQYRALKRWPGIWTTWRRQRVKLLEVRLSLAQLSPGAVEYQDKKIIVGTTSGSLEITRLQLEGRNATEANAFIVGAPQFTDSQLE